MPERNPAARKAAAILKQVATEKIRFINLQFTDIAGMVKSVTVPATKLPGIIKSGVWFDGSSIPGFAHIDQSDMRLKPDIDTFRVVPWERGENTTARLVCNVLTADGEPFGADPRQVLIWALKEAENAGFRFVTAPECEFFLFKLDGGVPTPHDLAGYRDYADDGGHEIRKEMANALHDFGIEVEASHHEVAVGQHEISFRYDDALRTADNTIAFKLTLKAVAQRHGLHATFMPKPVFGINGSGMHTNQSLFGLSTGKNAFYDRKEPNGLSRIARHFIAGQLAHVRGMSAVLSPLVNSYKRLVPGYEAPVYISWGRVNRSALIRIPRFSPENTESARIELRCPDPSCNPYLAFAVMLKCGLEGIREKLEPPPPTNENLYHFDAARLRKHGIGTMPGSLGEALDELEKDKVVQEALGPHITNWFLKSKRQEYDESRLQVTQWELDKYLPVY